MGSSQIINILIGLGLPWLIRNMASGTFSLAPPGEKSDVKSLLVMGSFQVTPHIIARSPMSMCISVSK